MLTTGLVVNYKTNYTFALDYATQNWSSVTNFNTSNYTLINSSRVSAGLQYTSFGAVRDNRGNTMIYEKYFYQAGFYSGNTYLNVKGQNINEWGITLSAGKQLNRSGLALQGTIEIGSRGTTNNGLLKENISQIGLTISYRDFWNTKKIKRYN